MLTGTQVTGQETPSASPGTRWLPSAGIALLAFLVYLPSLAHKFVFDDVAIIVHNPTVRSWQFLPDYFTRDLWQNVQPATGYYRPLLLVWFRLNFAAFGVHPQPWHLMNIAVHALAAVLVLRLAWRLTQNRTLAIVAGLLFTLHPVHVETVSWLSDAVDSLVTAWFLGGVLCFIKSRSGSQLWLVASLVCYGGAMLTKEPGATLPAVLFAYVVIFDDAVWPARLRHAAAAIAWYVPPAAIYLVARHHALHRFAVHAQSMSFGQLLLTLPGVVWSYARALVFPLALSPFYELEVVKRVSWNGFVAPALSIFLFVALLVLLARRMDAGGRKLLLFACAWIAVTVAPALDLPVFPPNEMAHDRYIYLASVGFSIAFAGLLMLMQARSRNALVALIVIAFAILTFQQQGFWKDDAAFYQRAFKIAPKNSLAEAGMANLFARQGDYEQAAKLYRDILQRDPNHLIANLNLGWTYVLTGNYSEAEPYLVNAATHYADRADCFFNLGVLYQKTGRLDLALASLRRAESLSPPHPGIEEKISEVEEAQGDTLGAIQSMQNAVQLDPTNQAYVVRLKSLQREPVENR